ncbi:unnamed protein product [Orchesella dallaii]|uniref:Dynamin-type G domain-containing protein n=1 Tax=Orchesella dallaii TaxID=48710 RepID=A0ABP1S4Z2_9HEXA
MDSNSDVEDDDYINEIAVEDTTNESGLKMELLNKLQDIKVRTETGGHKTDWDLPQIVVCGEQSSGKTSLLETISNEELLPKGDNIQTRCPIQLQLTRSLNNEKWVEFLHLPEGQRFTDMQEVKQVIENRNKEIVDANEFVSEKPIVLKLHSPAVMTDLTLVDLPGLRPSANDNDPADLSTRIENVVLTYLKKPNTIILVVVPATQDLENNSSLKFAQENADPRRARTIVVITKLEGAEKSNTVSNVYDALAGTKRTYNLGIIGVVNRFRNTDGSVISAKEASRIEKETLFKHFRPLATRNGLSYFLTRIGGLLIKQITNSLPKLKGLVEEQIFNLSEVLKSLGTKETDEQKRDRFLDYLHEFTIAYCGQIDGRKTGLRTDILPTSARIKHIWKDVFFPGIDKLEGGSNLPDTLIDNAILDTQGLQGVDGIVSVTDAFQHLVKEEIKKVQSLVLECARLVNKEMENAIETSHHPEAIRRYNNLTNRIASVTSDLIIQCFDECKRHLEDYIEAESCIAYSTEPAFVKKMSDASLELLQQLVAKFSETNVHDSSAPLQNAELLRTYIKKKICFYFDHVKECIKNYVPRAICCTLAYAVKKRLHKVLMKQVDGRSLKQSKETGEMIEEWLILMQESESLLIERNFTEKSLQSYLDAKEVIDSALASSQL